MSHVWTMTPNERAIIGQPGGENHMVTSARTKRFREAITAAYQAGFDEAMKQLGPRSRYVPSVTGKSSFAVSIVPDVNQPCVYFLTLNGEIVYVGQSRKLRERIGQHITHGKVFDGCAFMDVPELQLDETENYWINRLRPALNIDRRRRSGAQVAALVAERIQAGA